MKPIRVMIVDDHELLRLGLRAALEPEEDIDVVCDVGDARAALREAEHCRPDVVLMDVRMPGMDGIEACRALKESAPEANVVMLTSYKEEEAVLASIMAGARGYLVKETLRGELLTAVRRVAAGESLLSPDVTAQVLEFIKKIKLRDDEREVALLSDREKEVLVLVAKGLTNKEIAATLTIGVNTARNHVSRILDKLDKNSRTGAAIWAAMHGLTGVNKT